MTSRNRLFRMVFLLFLMTFASLAWSDTMSGVTSLAGQGANDSVNWAQLGANGTLLGAGFSANSGKALAVTGSFAGPNSITAVACAATPCSWRGAGFSAGDSLIWTSDAANGGNGPLSLSFAKSVSGAGAVIQADSPGAFTAQIQAFNGSTSLGTFSVSSANGNAAYIGIIDQTGANITSVAFSLTSCVGTCADFAIDTLELNTGGGTTFPLTVTLAGAGSGTVTSNPAGINCPGTCTANFASGTSVTLTAAAASGSSFAGWSGACSGSGTCTVTMSAAKSVTATFNTAQFPLTVSLAGTGSGTVTSNPAGINCPGTCSANFNSGTSVTLTAAAASGSTFAGWSGACTGTGTCTVIMSAAQSVTATFNSAQTFPLTVSLAGTGSGTVTSNPAGINCPGTCSANFNSGATVTLTAAAASGSTFAGWSGACSGTGSCTVTMNAAKSVTATFNASQFPFTVTLAGTGSGTVTSSPAGINCPGTCSANFNSGASVTLTAAAASGSTFAGWTGACIGTGTCTVTMNAAQSVTATFNSAQSFPLTVTLKGVGSGTVTSNPAGINCPGACSASFASGTLVTLSATPKSGSNFAGWGGACTGKGTCSVTMSAARSVTAKFTLATYKLTIVKLGNGTGTVKSSPTGIACGATCSHNFKAGSVVTLTETPGSGHTFGGWGGACSGSGATCKLTMTGPETVDATFN